MPVGNLFNLNAAFGRTNHRDARLGPVQNHCKIELARNTEALLNQYSPYLATFRPGLMGNQIVAEHGSGFFRGFVRAFYHFDPAALAAAPGMDLRLDDANRATQLGGSSLGFLRRRCDDAARDGNAESLEDLLGLKFVYVHRSRIFIKRDPKTKRLASGSQ